MSLATDAMAHRIENALLHKVMALKAFVNEQLEEGNPIDMELLGVFEYDQTKIITKKK